MYRKVRAIHRYAGLASLPFLLVYFASAVLMAHRTWWPVVAKRDVRTASLSRELGEPRAVAGELMKSGHVRGELLDSAVTPGGIRLSIGRPGVSIRVSYAPRTGLAEITTTERGSSGILTDLHKAAGFAYGHLPMRAWAGAAALMSLGLFLLGASGLYLWYRQASERRGGLVLLTAASVTLLYLIISMRI